MVPMRDGTKLLTVWYVPKGKTGPFPILLERTPYGAGSAERGPRRSTPAIIEAGYILAYQDVRGSNRSEGDFVDVRPILADASKGVDESSDTFDTVEYLIKNVDQNSGSVGLWGISYPGFYAGAGAVRNHPALKAVSPQAPVNDWFMGDDVHHRGAFFLQETFDFGVSFGARKSPDVQIDRAGKSAYDFFLDAGALSNYEEKFFKGKLPYWQELLENDTYNEYWKSRALWRSFKDVGCAVLTVGGWFDKEDMYGALQLYRAGEQFNPGTPNYLVMGPWAHGQWAGPGGAALGDHQWGSQTSTWYQDNVELPFFERYLKGRENVPAPAEATMFETGANKWHQLPQWPPAELEPRMLFLAGDAGLAWESPEGEGKKSYIYDPAKPTPYLADFANSRRAPGDWLSRGQNFLEDRSDVATFRLGPQTEDLRVAGPVVADLWITTTGTDADIVVQLLDEYPADSEEKSPRDASLAGHQMMVRGEILRGKFRDSFETPKPFAAGEPTRVRLVMNDVFHTFRKGHRIAVRVMSSWFPIADRNPNTFVSRKDARDTDFKPATITVHTGGQHESFLELGVIGQ